MLNLEEQIKQGDENSIQKLFEEYNIYNFKINVDDETSRIKIMKVCINLFKLKDQIGTFLFKGYPKLSTKSKINKFETETAKYHIDDLRKDLEDVFVIIKKHSSAEIEKSLRKAHKN
jgi:hypothetical protein